MYDCDIALTYAFNEVPPPKLTEQQINTLLTMFRETDMWFEKCPDRIKCRTSMIGYVYLIYKYCEMLSWDEFLPLIRLPKETTVKNYDNIWEWICANRTQEPHWAFMKTSTQ
jgi:hypothetical protein